MGIARCLSESGYSINVPRGRRHKTQMEEAAISVVDDSCHRNDRSREINADTTNSKPFNLGTTRSLYPSNALFNSHTCAPVFGLVNSLRKGRSQNQEQHESKLGNYLTSTYFSRYFHTTPAISLANVRNRKRQARKKGTKILSQILVTRISLAKCVTSV